VLIACRVDDNGDRNILCCSLSLSEAEGHRPDFLSELKSRGMHCLELIVSDSHEGLKATRKAVFQSVLWALPGPPVAKSRPPRAKNGNAIIGCGRYPGDFQRVVPGRSRASPTEVGDMLRDDSSAARRLVRGTIPEGSTAFSLPECHRRKVRMMNLFERLNEYIRRRTRVARLFPNEAARLRLDSPIRMQISGD
jgi:putative transposase